MTLKEAIVQCVRVRDGRMAVGIATTLQKRGYGYHQTYDYVRRHCEQPLCVADWDELLREGECS